MDINDRLTLAKERLRHRQKLDAMLRQAREVLAEEQRKQTRNEQVLAREQRDVEKLEGLSLTGLFHAVLGTKEERLEKERQEYLAAKLKHHEATQAAGEAMLQVERLERELAPYRNAAAEYDRVIEEKERFISQGGGERAAELLDLSERLAELESDRKELKEAVAAGEKARYALEEASGELRSAEGWGTWDLLGGGTLATMAKHSRIDSARERAEEARRHLHRFREELADADRRLHVSLGEIGGFSTFADYFLDGLIADWVVQSRVRQSLEACSSAVSQVAAALGECRRRLAEVEREIEQVATRRREFVERA